MARQPTPIADILADLIARHGFARIWSAEVLEKAWKRVIVGMEAGNLIADHTRISKLSRGQLEVVVDHSTLLHELEYEKAKLLKSLAQQLPRETIKGLRFRLGTIK